MGRALRGWIDRRGLRGPVKRRVATRSRSKLPWKKLKKPVLTRCGAETCTLDVLTSITQGGKIHFD